MAVNLTLFVSYSLQDLYLHPFSWFTASCYVQHVGLLYMIILLATTNAIFHLFIALVVAHNPFHPAQYLMNECAIGFSGILFSMIVIETNLSGVQSRRLVILMLSLAICYMTRSLLIFNFLHHFRDSICNGSGGTKFPRVMLHTLPLPHTHFHIP